MSVKISFKGNDYHFEASIELSDCSETSMNEVANLIEKSGLRKFLETHIPSMARPRENGLTLGGQPQQGQPNMHPHHLNPYIRFGNGMNHNYPGSQFHHNPFRDQLSNGHVMGNAFPPEQRTMMNRNEVKDGLGEVNLFNTSQANKTPNYPNGQPPKEEDHQEEKADAAEE